MLYEGKSITKDHLYGPSNFNFATVHKIDLIGGAPQVMPGRPITESDLQALARSLAEADKAAVETRWVDPSVLAQGPDRLIWWTPPTKRALYFKKSSVDSTTFTGAGVCAIPGLVWVAFPNKALYVYAVKGCDRPTQETKLFQAPFFNVWGRGQICVGNAVLPQKEEQWLPKAWEKFFLESHFTHPNFSQKDRLVKRQNPVTFWKRMLKKPADVFPENVLVNIPLNVQDLMDPTFMDLLRSRIAKPTGEF